MKKSLILLWVSLISCSVFAQDENLVYQDHVYLDNIRSIKFHPTGLMTEPPLINLGSSSQIYLTFDDLDPDVKIYTYRLIHCDADWTPSDLTEGEYINGYQEEEIDNFEFSFNTFTQFTNYYLTLPNEDMVMTRSGNYLLVVYEDEDERILAFTRRFMVVDPIMRVFPENARPGMVSKFDTHQEIDFVVSHENINIRNPQIEISAAVLQNGRWDNAIQNIKPQFQRTERLVFDFQDKIVFPAGKEFRFLDLRTLRNPSGEIYQIEQTPTSIDVTLLKDEKRFNKPYFEYDELNGQFVVETFDGRDPNLESDYCSVLFSLYSPTEYYDEDVYIMGAFTDWELKPEAKMVYNNRVNAYVGKYFLKQGYYNYYYALVPKAGGPPQIDITEGNWFETENMYTVLVYYRPFGTRYDQLVAARTISSRD